MTRQIDSAFLHRALKYYYGYDSFRNGQEEIVTKILHGQPVLAVLPTGAGKSICFQLPSLLLKGVTLVISPLISLMKDQAEALTARGIPAAYLDSSMTGNEYGKVLHAALNKECKFLYVAPERLANPQFVNFAQKAYITMVAVDEAHCVSQWGHSFRKDYYNIPDFIDALPHKPLIAAFTATATPDVRKDICLRLNMPDAYIVVTGFDRPNLHFAVERTQDKDRSLLEFLRKHKNQCGVIYCATRNKVERVTQQLQRQGYRALRYHAGLTPEERRDNQNFFVGGQVPLIVATNAFGMGIDKADVRFVVHYNMPKDIESYYQEAGRAGRDGENSQCVLLFSAQDVMIDRMLLDNKDFSDVDEEDEFLIRQRDIRRLQIMEGYCKTTGCLRNYILEYFGEKTFGPCDNCGNCHREYHETDMTREAKWVVNCVAETRGRYGLTIVLGTLLGAKRARLRELGADKYKSYGALNDHSEAELRALISQMTEMGYLYQTQERYSVLKLGDISPLRDENTHVIMRTYEEKEPDKKKKPQKSVRKRSTDALTAAGYDLFEALRKLRLEIAKEEAMPPYIVFSDKTLIDMCIKCPSNEEEMLEVSGVGENKLKKYGQRFLEEIQKFCLERPNAVLSMSEDENGNP